MLYAFTGLIAGLLHVVSGPDHLSAIAPLSIEKGKSSWKIGFLWGFGHTGGVLVIALIALFSREIIPIDLISSWSERFVGIVLIGLGIWGLRKLLSGQVHSHPHVHNGEKHFHVHVHKKHIQHTATEAHLHTHAALAVGVLHGIAGSSHLFGVIPALALPSTTAAIIYLSGYGAGTIISMVLFSLSIGIAAQRLSEHGDAALKKMMFCFSAGAIIVGFFWLMY